MFPKFSGCSLTLWKLWWLGPCDKCHGSLRVGTAQKERREQSLCWAKGWNIRRTKIRLQNIVSQTNIAITKDTILILRPVCCMHFDLKLRELLCKLQPEDVSKIRKNWCWTGELADGSLCWLRCRWILLLSPKRRLSWVEWPWIRPRDAKGVKADMNSEMIHKNWKFGVP